VQAAAVDLGCRDDADRHLRGRFDDRLEELLAAGRRMPLGIVQEPERRAAAAAQPVDVEADGGGH